MRQLENGDEFTITLPASVAQYNPQQGKTYYSDVNMELTYRMFRGDIELEQSIIVEEPK